MSYSEWLSIANGLFSYFVIYATAIKIWKKAKELLKLHDITLCII